MKYNLLATIVSAAAALTLTTAAYAQSQAGGDDRVAASPRMRQMLDERKASAPVAVPVPAMACAKCADVVTAEPNSQVKGAQLLAGTATHKVTRHTCTACQTSVTVSGEGKTGHQVTSHKCSMQAAGAPNCCASR